MTDTSMTLLNRLQHADDSEAWQQLLGLYGPLLAAWLRKYDVQAADSDDLVQEVLMAVSKNLTAFDHNGRPGAFRAWLRSIMVHRLRTFWRTRGRHAQSPGDSDIERRLSQLDDPASEMSQLWNRQHDQHIAQRLLAACQQHFTAETWNAFTRVAIDGQRPDIVAAELGISLNAVFIAKSRVLSRLRQEAAGLLESSSDFSANP
jgi:RNA polymerase sigma-70 factor (ECF subfamily)